MLVKTTNNRLYDSRNFDKYKNYYAILFDKRKYEINKINNDEETLYAILTSYTREIYIMDLNSGFEKADKNPYSIVYGHFYNNQNYFLFKRIHNDKIVGININKCKRAELWHNKLNQLYITNYFDDIKHTVQVLNSEIKAETAKPHGTLSVIIYNAHEEMLSFKDMWTSDYDNERVEIIPINPYHLVAV